MIFSTLRTHSALARRMGAANRERERTEAAVYFQREASIVVTVLGLVGGAPGGETPRVADFQREDLAE